MNLLKTTSKIVCKPVSILIDPNAKVGLVEEDAMINREIYQRSVGKAHLYVIYIARYYLCGEYYQSIYA